jgi:hypothetical protein
VFGEMSVGGCILARPASPSDASTEAGASRPTLQFPAPADLERLPSRPAPAEAFSTDAIAVDDWGVLDPAARERERPSPDALWQDYLRSTVLAHRDTLRLSAELRCTAAEIARFRVEKGGQPAEPLRRFMVGRCGATSPDAIPLVVTLTSSSALSDRAVYERTRPTLEKLVEHVLEPPRRRVIGLSSTRMGSEFAVVVVVGGDEVDMANEPRTIDDSRRVVVSGSFRSVFADAAAYINRGD